MMGNVTKIYRFLFAVSLFSLAIGVIDVSHAATTDLATAPLASATSVVRPNILFTLDDSGSMAWDYLPDYAGGGMGTTANHCKVSNTCGNGDTPFQTNEYNGMAYNPRITYSLPVNADGTLKPSQGSPWTAVKVDGYGIQSNSSINMTNGYPEVVYGNGGNCSGTTCKKNGVDTTNPFLLRATITADNPPVYAFPGTLTTGSSVLSTLNDGLMNQASTTTGTVFNGTLNIDTAAVSLTLSGVSVSHNNSLVTVNYTATTPALASGDTVVVSGGTCSSGYKSGGGSLVITRVDATHFTYASTTGASWTNTSCSITATKPAITATPPSISKSGNIVTVTLSSAPTPALANGNAVTVGNGSGTCDPGYKATSATMTRISNTSFSYSVATGVTTPGNASCNITQTATVSPASPGISLAGSTVTVYKTAHGLVTGDLIQVSNGTSGTCDSGYQTSSTVTVTRIDANTFTYGLPVGSATTNSNCKINKIQAASTANYTSAGTVNSNPYYFVMIPTEYCDSIYLTKCVAATGPVTVSGVVYSYPAPVRFCKNDTTAALPPGDAGAQTSGTTINCQAKYSPSMNFLSVRYGLFWRGDIVPSTTTYGNESYSGTVNAGGVNLAYSGTLAVDRSKRSDCASAPNCTYAEEMTNFSNWYAYYHTRIQMMKSSAGRAFSTLDNRYRVGFVTINESSSRYLPVAMFDTTQKTNWYSKFYAINPGNSTPLREAMANAGRYFAGKKPGIFTDDPMEYACQQNFELITTDGYWNGNDSSVKDLNGNTMGNFDNVDSGASKRADGAYDGAVSGASNTLADVAMYYYKTDLRNSTLGNCTGALGGDVCQDIVPMTSKDTAAGLAATQHMSTFSLGLADGLMTYQSDYENAITGDFSKIKSAATGCPFSGSGTCNWPLPVMNTQTALDDLWHAAVNGRGTYYNARDPASLSAGLSSALTGINVRLAAASSSATSSPNITQTDRSIFSSTYRTTKWDGEVTAQLINATTGAVEPAIIWSAQTQLDALIHADASSDITSRHIYTFDNANSLGNHLKDFIYTSLTAAEQGYFDNKCSFTLLSQCTAATLSAAQISSGNSGLNLVQYLRGNQSLEPTGVFRTRDHLLGDTVNARPAYVKLPQYSFTDSGYTAFKAAQTAIPRQGALYMGANDGMLHAFNTDTGAEMWAYLPKIVMPNLYKLADASYATLHQYYVDGSPETMDVYDTTLNLWRTILIGGFGLGGRGFYALDVTDPANPIALWEICSDSTICAISDPDMGYSYGNPVITKRSGDNKWVVLLTSGYNNVSPGSGVGTLFVLDALTGAVLNKTPTGGATNPPSGLAKLSPWVDNLSTNFTTRYLYSGDLNGDVWRFDLGAVGVSAAPTRTLIASLKDSSGVAQSVTTRVELGDPLGNTANSLSGTGNPAVYVTTGRYLGATDVSNLQIQSVYGIKDDLSKSGGGAYIGNPRAPITGFGPFVQQYIYQPTATTRTTSQFSVNWASNSGWYADFVVSNPVNNLPITPSASPGERVNLDAQLMSGTLIVVTNVPESSACTMGGTSWLYSFNYLTGQNVPAATDQLVGQKIPGNSLTVGIVSVRLPSGQIKEITTTAGGSTLTLTPATTGVGATRRTSWRELTTQ
jgi:type IV pilus assembly protein PilY1